MQVNNTPDTMTSSSQILERLKSKGIDKEYRYDGRGLRIGDGKSYAPDELEIVKIYRFEGVSDPSDMEVIYLIRSKDGVTGFFQEVYGVYANQEGMEALDNFLRQLPEAGHDEQLSFEL